MIEESGKGSSWKKQTGSAPETLEKPLSNSMSSHRYRLTLKNYQKHNAKRLRRRQNPGESRPNWGGTKFPLLPYLEQVEPN